MKIGVSLDPSHARFVELARQADRIGIDSIWVAEFWEVDAFTPLAAAASVTERVRLGTGIAQLGARTPAMLAMTARGVQMLSNGRLVLGIGTSGPQVMEGWHGVRFDRPIERTRETIEILRMIGAGERLEYHGDVYDLPLPDGQGKAIRSRVAVEPIPIHVASLGPRNLALTGRLADGWIGNSFFADRPEFFLDPIAAGAAQSGRRLTDLELVVAVGLDFTDDDPASIDAAARRHADGYAFTFGAMGSSTTNFYNDAFARQGFAEDVAEVQRLWLAGDRSGAAARVPIEIGRDTNLIGPPAMVSDRIAAYSAAGIDVLRISLPQDFDRAVLHMEMICDLVR